MISLTRWQRCASIASMGITFVHENHTFFTFCMNHERPFGFKWTSSLDEWKEPTLCPKCGTGFVRAPQWAKNGVRDFIMATTGHIKRDVVIPPIVPTRCARCRKEFTESDKNRIAGFQKFCKGRKSSCGSRFYLDGDSMMVWSHYHIRCVPPNLFHRLAAAAPAHDNHGPLETSTEDVGGTSDK